MHNAMWLLQVLNDAMSSEMNSENVEVEVENVEATIEV